MICDIIFCLYTGTLSKDVKSQRYEAVKIVIKNEKPTRISVGSLYQIHCNDTVITALANSCMKCQEDGNNMKTTEGQATCVDAFHFGLDVRLLNLVGFARYTAQRPLKQDFMGAC